MATFLLVTFLHDDPKKASMGDPGMGILKARLFRNVQVVKRSITHLPSWMTTSGPMTTLGPIRQSWPIFAVGSFRKRNNKTFTLEGVSKLFCVYIFIHNKHHKVHWTMLNAEQGKGPTFLSVCHSQQETAGVVHILLNKVSFSLLHNCFLMETGSKETTVASFKRQGKYTVHTTKTFPIIPGPSYKHSGFFFLIEVRSKPIPVRKSLGWPTSIQKPETRIMLKGNTKIT